MRVCALNTRHGVDLSTRDGVDLSTRDSSPSLSFVTKVRNPSLTGGQMFYSITFRNPLVTIGTFVNIAPTAERHVRRTRHNERHSDPSRNEDIVECYRAFHSFYTDCR
jgi:hypothetical protein